MILVESGGELLEELLVSLRVVVVRVEQLVLALVDVVVDRLAALPA
jgi:hypothetical protein